MSIRDDLANGNFTNNNVIEIDFDIEIPEGNSFEIKRKDRLCRMIKSARARAHRAEVREIKARKHTSGFHGS
jgi:hypothetical protein